MYEEQVLKNEDLPDELQQQDSTSEKEITNNEIAPVTKVYYNNFQIWGGCTSSCWYEKSTFQWKTWDKTLFY